MTDTVNPPPPPQYHPPPTSRPPYPPLPLAPLPPIAFVIRIAAVMIKNTFAHTHILVLMYVNGREKQQYWNF